MSTPRGSAFTFSSRFLLFNELSFQHVDEAVDRKVWTHQTTDIASVAQFLGGQDGWMISFLIVLLRKFQCTGWAELHTEPAAFASLGRNDDRTAGFFLLSCNCHGSRIEGLGECSYLNLSQITPEIFPSRFLNSTHFGKLKSQE